MELYYLYCTALHITSHDIVIRPSGNPWPPSPPQKKTAPDMSDAYRHSRAKELPAPSVGSPGQAMDRPYTVDSGSARCPFSTLTGQLRQSSGALACLAHCRCRYASSLGSHRAYVLLSESRPYAEARGSERSAVAGRRDERSVEKRFRRT